MTASTAYVIRRRTGAEWSDEDLRLFVLLVMGTRAFRVRLRPRWQRILFLHFAQGYGKGAIAKSIGCSIPIVTGMIDRCLWYLLP